MNAARGSLIDQHAILAAFRDPDMVMSTVATVARPWMAQCPRSGERSYNRSPKTRTQFDAARCLAMRLLPRTKSVMSGSLALEQPSTRLSTVRFSIAGDAR